jgi:hypothetical protein
VWEGSQYLVDSALDFMKVLMKHSTDSDEAWFETNLICTIFNITASHEAISAAVSKWAQEIMPLKRWDEKADHLFATLPVFKDSP